MTEKHNLSREALEGFVDVLAQFMVNNGLVEQLEKGSASEPQEEEEREDR